MAKSSTVKNTMPAMALTTINSALKILLAAITRARCCGSARCCNKAYSGTINKPPNTPINVKSVSTHQPKGVAKNCGRFSSCAGSSAGLLKYKLTPNNVKPTEPIGTIPSSTLSPDKRSHNIEPIPTPTENATNNAVTTVLSPPSTVLVKLGNWVK